MQINAEYDVAIVGGGLSGLAAAILLQKNGHSVVVFEKEKYPFHKVCGEYISLESWNFLEQFGLPLQQLNLPIIDTLFISAPNGNSFATKLPLGGFGLSRYQLDSSLAEIAKHVGVHLIEETKVDEVEFDECFSIKFKSQQIKALVCCAAYGKRSNLDIKWKRSFLKDNDKRLDNYVGIKYHIKSDWPQNVIGLHNFEHGYCGISKIENDDYCLCYMTKAENLKKCNNSIEQLQEKILFKNPHLKKIFSESKFWKEFPVTISQINFNKKTQVENHVLMLGDAAGMITPLCGNGMSIALHTGKIAGDLIHDFLTEKISRVQLENFYTMQWKSKFSKRLQTGRMIQQFFGSNQLSNFFVQAYRYLPFLAKQLIKRTHGKRF